MALDGTWNLRITTPMGVNSQRLDLATDGDAVSGTAHTMGGEVPLQDAAFADGRLTFTIEVTAPFPMTIRMSLAIDGDTVTGTSQAGAFPEAPVEGERAA
ncbi:hypothetical protein [uncultured Amnibacterium sp.]|uniref:hypothetical protein n=1 Tax=uncultured Amnibacterium sp. TaxID=1631851 RepID=UPI0035CBBF8E